MTTASVDQHPTVGVEDWDAETGLPGLLDAAIAQIVELETRGYRPTRLIVSRAAYEQIAVAHQRDLERGVPLIVLGLLLIYPAP